MFYGGENSKWSILSKKTDEEYLQHHGILGMKLGIRRYRNKDGSLTQAGKKRYYEDDGVTLTKKGQAQYDKQKNEIDTMKKNYVLGKMASKQQFERLRSFDKTEKDKQRTDEMINEFNKMMDKKASEIDKKEVAIGKAFFDKYQHETAKSFDAMYLMYRNDK